MNDTRFFTRKDLSIKFIYVLIVVLLFLAFYNFNHNLNDSQQYNSLDDRVSAIEAKPCATETPSDNPTPQN